jgi:hypothetical protein
VARLGGSGSGQGGGGVLGACTCLGLACRWSRVRSRARSYPGGLPGSLTMATATTAMGKKENMVR